MANNKNKKDEPPNHMGRTFYIAHFSCLLCFHPSNFDAVNVQIN